MGSSVQYDEWFKVSDTIVREVEKLRLKPSSTQADMDRREKLEGELRSLKATYFEQGAASHFQLQDKHRTGVCVASVQDIDSRFASDVRVVERFPVDAASTLPAPLFFTSVRPNGDPAFPRRGGW